MNLGIQFPNIITRLDSNTIIHKANAFVNTQNKNGNKNSARTPDQAQKDGINKEKIAFRTIRDTDENGKPLDTGKYVAYQILINKEKSDAHLDVRLV